MYKFSVEGGILDFVGEPKIILMANAPGDYSFGRAHKTYYVKLIDTANNRRILSEYKKLDASLTVDDITYQGILYIDENEDGVKYGQFVSGVGAIWDNIRGLKLADLDFSEYNHTLNKTNVDASETAGGFYKYDLVFRGTPIENQEVTATRVYDITERFPAFNVYGILEKIFEGYELVNETDVFDNNLYVLFTEDYEFRNTNEWKEQNTRTLPKSFVQSDIDNQVGADGEFNTSLEPITIDAFPFAITETGAYRFDFKIDARLRAVCMSGAAETGDIVDMTSEAVVFLQSTTRGVLLERRYTFNASSAAPTVDVSFDIDTRYLEMTRGEQVYLEIFWDGEYDIPVPPADPGLKATLTVQTTSQCRVLPKRYYGIGATVEVAKLMPDMEILDFVRGICQWFNIGIYTDLYTRKVMLWPGDKINGVVNWSDRVMRDKAYTISKPDEKIFRYTTPKDDSAKDWQRDIDYDFGSIGDVKEIKLISHYLAIQRDYTNLYEWPLIYNDTEKTYTRLNATEFKGTDFRTNFGLRMAYEADNFDYPYTLVYTDIGGTLTTTKRFTEGKTEIPGWSFADLYMETLRPWGLSYNVKGLFDKYHRKTVEAAIDGQHLTCVLLLKGADILNMVNLEDGKDWRTAVHIDGKNYRVLELEQLDGNIYKGRFQEVYL